MGLVTIPDMELMSVGDWKAGTGDVTFTEQDLRDVLASQSAPDIKEPRLVLGHTNVSTPASMVDGFYGEQPALGKFCNLRLSADNQTLMADLAGVPAWLAEILPTAYPNRSVEVYWDVPSYIPEAKNHAAVMPRVALLGINLPAVATLEDLKVFFSDEGPELDAPPENNLPPEPAMMKASKFVFASRGTERTAASVQYEDVRRDFYNNFATDDSGRYWWWINAVYVEPPILVVDDDEEGLWAVPYSVAGDETEFGDPVSIKVQYVENETGKVAASQATALGKRYTKAASRPTSRTKEKKMGIDISALRTRTGLSVDQLPDDATDEQINAALMSAAEPGDGEGEKEPEEQPAEGGSEGEEKEEQPAEGGTQASTGTVTVDAESFKAMQAQLSTLTEDREEQVKASRTDEVKKAIKAGKIPPSRKDHYVKLMKADPKGTKELLDGLEAVLPVNETELGADDGGASHASQSEYDLSWLTPTERARAEAARAGAPVETSRIVTEA